MSKIFEPLILKSVTFKNRIGMAPMCQYSASDGFANSWHYVHYGTRAVGRTGLIIQEASAIAPEGRITPYDLGIWKDEHIDKLKEITTFISSRGSVPAIQLAHAGRKASCDFPTKGGKQLSVENGGWQTVAPSAIPFFTDDNPPHALSEIEIGHIVSQFKDAAVRALQAGFKVIEIHAAHGYLIHQFLSPLSNQRTDQFGGSFENRIRFILLIVDAVHSVWPDNLPLFVRLSATDWVEGGWNLDETVELSAILKNKGVDLFDCSSGGNIATAKIPLKPMYQVPFADAIRKTGIHTAAVGLITNQQEVNSILENEQADMVLLGRELLRNPYFALQAGADFPEQYLRAK